MQYTMVMVSFESKAQLSKRTYESDLKWRMIYQMSVQGLTLKE